MRSIDDLRQMQALPLNLKVSLTQSRIRQWVNEYGENGVYISFSGGKDSTVLLDIARKMYPDLLAVFVDTGLEFPEIREFVKTFDNVEIIKPKMNFKKVVEKYGYPFPSKEASECIYGARRYLESLLEQTERQTDCLMNNSIEKYADNASMQNRSRGGADSKHRKLRGIGEFSKIQNIENSQELADILSRKKQNREGGENMRLARMLNMLTRDNQIQTAESIPESDRSAYAQTRWKFFLKPGAPRVSSECCKVMKKGPAHDFAKKTKRQPMTAEMADESRLRTQKWLQHGCNGFDMKAPKSMPMAFWTEQDVLQYVKEYNIPIASVYGDIVFDENKSEQIEGQMQLNLDGTITETEGMLKTTGCKRTGCMFCGYGCHLEKPGEGRFALMKKTHPKQYEWIMKPWSEGGLGYKDVIDWINEHGNLHIEY